MSLSLYSRAVIQTQVCLLPNSRLFSYPYYMVTLAKLLDLFALDFHLL